MAKKRERTEVPKAVTKFLDEIMAQQANYKDMTVEDFDWEFSFRRKPYQKDVAEGVKVLYTHNWDVDTLGD